MTRSEPKRAQERLRVLGIVPARKGSTRLPGKNVADLGGVPLATWAMRAGVRARSLSALVVSSDDERVLDLGRQEGLLAIERPPELATSDAPALAYVEHALATTPTPSPFNAVCILQPTSPFTEPGDIDQCIDLLAESGGDSAVTVVRVPHDVNPVKMMRLEAGRLVDHFDAESGRMRADEVPELYVRNGSVYVSRRATIETGSILGGVSHGWEMSRERSVDINEAFDLELAKFLLERGEGRPSFWDDPPNPQLLARTAG